MPQTLKTALQQLTHGNFPQSIPIFQSLLYPQPPPPPPPPSQSHKPQTYLHLSVAYLQSGDYPKCQQTCNKIIKMFPNFQRVYTVLIVCLAYMGRYDMAVGLCEDRLKGDSRSWELYFVKGYVMDMMRKYEEATENYTIAITKNMLNNPRTYMLQAATLINLDQPQAATKSIHYAQLAMQQDPTKNCQGQYQFQIQNIKCGLNCYKYYQKKLQQAETDLHITKTQREIYHKQLIKIAGKSVHYRSTAYRHFRGRGKDEKDKERDRKREIGLTEEEISYSEFWEFGNEKGSEKGKEKGKGNQVGEEEESDFWNQVQIFADSLSMKVKESYKYKVTKDTISSDILDKNQTESKIACEWIRQKCCIY